jgi:hypothetical protein
VASQTQRARPEHELIGRPDQHVVANRPPQVVERLPQRATAFILAQLRPKQREQLVTPHGRVTRLEREVREEGDALRLRATRPGFGLLVGDEADAAECEQLAHGVVSTGGSV